MTFVSNAVPAPPYASRSSEGRPAVSVRGVSKAYNIVHDTQRPTTAAEALLRRLKNPLYRPPTERFWALKDVSFDVERGEVVGIIGRNGAGKSTLLKVLSRITEPTEGEAVLRGRLGSLLEVGTGFHPELTGRENIFMNGAILGMRRREIERQFDSIVEFSGTEKFLDTPVKRYSSGMYVRLAFAIAAHLNPEILIVDEVLAVGDAEFQKKCMGKMHDVAQSGRTVLFVSHNIGAVRQLCTSAVYLERGTVGFTGNVEEALERYIDAATTARTWERPAALVSAAGAILSAGVSVAGWAADDHGDVDHVDLTIDDELEVSVRYALRERLPGVQAGLVLHREGVPLFTSFDTDAAPAEQQAVREPGVFRATVTVPRRFLKAGRYSLDLSLTASGGQSLDSQNEVLGFEIDDTQEDTTHRSYARHRPGYVIAPAWWRTEREDGVVI